MPWTSGNLMPEEESGLGMRLACTDMAVQESVERTVEGPSSMPESIIECIPIGLMKY